MTTFCDRVSTSSSVRRTPEGYMVTTAKVARSGVQEYLGAEVGRPDLTTVKIYRPEDEVFSDATMRSFAHRPMTMNHPRDQVTASNWRDHAIGNTGSKVHRDGDYIVVDLVMMDQGAIQAFEGGTRELSMGYDAVIEFTSGTTAKGERYDGVQRQIRNNHLALVGSARGGAELRIGDGEASLDDVRAQARADHEKWVRDGSPSHPDPVARALAAGVVPVQVGDNGYAQYVADLDYRTRKKPEPVMEAAHGRPAQHQQDSHTRPLSDNGYGAFVAGLDYRTRGQEA